VNGQKEKIVEQRLSIVTLGVSDFDRSMKFYRDGLGWKPSSTSSGDIAFFSMGGVVLALYPREKLAEDATVPASGSGFSGFTLAYNTRSQDEVDAVLKSVDAIGAKIIKHAQHVFWGGYSGYFADPDGYLWEVAWNPGSEFDESGSLKLP
jgi:catechol 2,3-dioxygenase-like lactoylglutathione lyase family enzyme